MVSYLRMSSKRGLVLADDATGALECASLLSGFEVAIALNTEQSVDEGILVADTETRHLLPGEAGRRIARWASLTDAAIFKKTDSTLRGNIAAELLALLPRGPLVYVPAYPALGRTVQNGRLLIHGVPVDQTDFARDARHPVRSPVIADLFPPELAVSIGDATELVDFLKRGLRKIAICDATSDAELDRLTGALQGSYVTVTVAGPGGFVKAWASLGAYPRKFAMPTPSVGDWLVVCGSRHPQSRRQARLAELAGLTVLVSAEEERLPEVVAAELAQRAVGWIAAYRRGQAGRPVLPLGVLVMGGDTAWALWRELAITQLIPLPEVLPGVAVCRSGELVFVTKAGGFGGDDLVARVRERF